MDSQLAAEGGADLPAGPPAQKRPRLTSLDAFRGFIILAMIAGDLGLTRALAHYTHGTPLGDAVVFHADHVPWEGGSFWDTIQPGFFFLVGASVPFSYARRRARGDSEARITAHALLRAAVLIVPIVLHTFLTRTLSARGSGQTNYGLTHVLVQIGLGYVFVFALRRSGLATQAATVVVILAGYTLLFAAHPTPGPGDDWSALVLPDDRPRYAGWFAHWDAHTNAAGAFDRWLLNLPPRTEPFRYKDGGYQTLNFVPSIATMILGLMAGTWLRSDRTAAAKFVGLMAAGAACLALGGLAGEFVCPVVKRIWTPSWVLVSGGIAFLQLAGFSAVTDVAGYRRWAYPLVVAGSNALVLYLLSQLLKDVFEFDPSRPGWSAVWCAAGFAAVWLVGWGLHRRGWFLRV